MWSRGFGLLFTLSARDSAGQLAGRAPESRAQIPWSTSRGNMTSSQIRTDQEGSEAARCNGQFGSGSEGQERRLFLPTWTSDPNLTAERDVRHLTLY